MIIKQTYQHLWYYTFTSTPANDSADSGVKKFKERVPDKGCLQKEVQLGSFSWVRVINIYFVSKVIWKCQS